MHILVTGAPGSGTTTLGQALARKLSCPHLDSDDFLWLRTRPPFQVARDAQERQALLRSALAGTSDVVLSGSIVGWGPDVESGFDLIVFLYLPTDLRLRRIVARDLKQHGEISRDFLRWAAEYDEAPEDRRSLASHTRWLSQRACPVLRLERDQTVAQRVRRVLEALPDPATRRNINGTAPSQPGRPD